MLGFGRAGPQRRARPADRRCSPRTDVGQRGVDAAQELREAGEDRLLEVVEAAAELVLSEAWAGNAASARDVRIETAGGTLIARCCQGAQKAVRTMGDGGVRRISSVRQAAWT